MAGLFYFGATMTNAISPETPLRGSSLAAVFFLAVAGLGLRLWAAAANEFPTVDGVYYLNQAAAMVDQHRLVWSCFPPGWSAIIAVPYLFMAEHDPASLLRAGHLANVVLGTLMPLLAFWVMRPSLGNKLASVGLAVLMFLPLDIIYSKNDLSEMSYTCVMLAVWLFWRRRRLATAGFLIGCAYLIRPEALLAGAALGLCRRYGKDRLPWRQLLRFWGATLLVMIPYLIDIRLQSGSFDLTSKTVALSLSLAANPGWHYLGLIARNLGVFLPQILGVTGVPLVALAIWGLVRNRGQWWCLFAPLLPVPFIINAMDVRFWVPYLPLVVWAAGRGWVDLAQSSFLRRRPRRRWPLAAILALGLGVAARDGLYFVKMNTEAFYGLKEAGAWLRQQTDQNTVIAAYKPYTSYWAGTKFIKYPAGMDALSVAIWARNSGASYVIANVQVIHHLAPELDALLGSPLPPELAPHLELVKVFSYDPVIHTTVVYRIRGADATQ